MGGWVCMAGMIKQRQKTSLAARLEGEQDGALVYDQVLSSVTCHRPCRDEANRASIPQTGEGNFHCSWSQYLEDNCEHIHGYPHHFLPNQESLLMKYSLKQLAFGVAGACLLTIYGCGGAATSTAVDPRNGLLESSTARACTYTPYAGARKQCTNVDSRYCGKYNYGTVGDETSSLYSTCANLGY